MITIREEMLKYKARNMTIDNIRVQHQTIIETENKMLHLREWPLSYKLYTIW